MGEEKSILDLGSEMDDPDLLSHLHHPQMLENGKEVGSLESSIPLGFSASTDSPLPPRFPPDTSSARRQLCFTTLKECVNEVESEVVEKLKEDFVRLSRLSESAQLESQAAEASELAFSDTLGSRSSAADRSLAWADGLADAALRAALARESLQRRHGQVKLRRLHAHIDRLEEQLSVSTAVAERQSEGLQTLHSALEAFTEEAAEKEAVRTSLASRAIQDADELRHSLHLSRQLSQALQSRCRQLETALNARSHQVSALVAEKTELEESQAHCKAEVERLEKEAEEQQKNVQLMSQEKIELQRQLANLSTDVTELERLLKNSNSEQETALEASTAEAEKAARELERERENWASEKAALLLEWETRIGHLQSQERSRREGEVRAVKKEADASIAAARKAEIRLREERDALRSRVEKLVGGRRAWEEEAGREMQRRLAAKYGELVAEFGHTTSRSASPPNHHPRPHISYGHSGGSGSEHGDDVLGALFGNLLKGNKLQTPRSGDEEPVKLGSESGRSHVVRSYLSQALGKGSGNPSLSQHRQQ